MVFRLASMILKDLIIDLHPLSVEGDVEIEVKHITLDSRTAGPGSLFFAVRGVKVDGHDFINEVITHGATTIVCEVIPENTYKGVTYIKVSKVSECVGIIASAFYGHPSLELIIVGVTGTNGKTTIATTLYELFTKLGHKSGLISTVENKIGSDIIPATHTTPDAISLQEHLRKMSDADCKYVFMEVSSHAVDQGRIKNIYFLGGIFTNLTQDHLDYHKTMGEYAGAKKAFFDSLPETAFALANIDDEYGEFMIKDSMATHITYAEGKGDFAFTIKDSTSAGMTLTIKDTSVSSPLVGKFNAYNLTAIFATAVLLDQPSDKVASALGGLTGARGRMEKILGASGKIGIVDYAHTPDALENALTTVNNFKGTNKVITVFGAGGDRDKGKRPLMGAIASSLSDIAIVTSDNPRTENPESIIVDIVAGVSDRKNIEIIPDREDAIKRAVEIAGSGDIILVAGKGHENYQEVNGVKSHFSDNEVLKKYL